MLGDVYVYGDVMMQMRVCVVKRTTTWCTDVF